MTHTQRAKKLGIRVSRMHKLVHISQRQLAYGVAQRTPFGFKKLRRLVRQHIENEKLIARLNEHEHA